MFDRARLRLTAWYLAILSGIMAVLSVAFYDVATRLQQAEVHAIGLAAARRGLARLVARDATTLLWQLIAVDAGVLILAALGSYVLAGSTLRPIQAAMDRQQRFAMAASHELRTPLTVLQGTMEVALLRRRAPEEYERLLQDAVAEAGRMGVLIADLLTLARSQHDQALLRREALDLAGIAGEALAGVRPLAEEKRQTLEVALGGALPVWGDGLKLRQAVANLLDNAVAYTPRGGLIRLSGRREQGRAVLEVRDTGAGIPRHHLAHLFEPFYRVDTARAGGAGHVGLGLALAAWIARAHGGHLWVESKVGRGSAFTLSVPLAGEQASGVQRTPRAAR